MISFAPIATQIARWVSLDELCSRGSVEAALRDLRKQPLQPGETPLPDDIAPFFGHYLVTVRAAVLLLDSPPFDGLARFHEQIEDEYMPGGPPQSPVYDSFAMQFVLSAVPQGIGNETPYSVLARLLLADKSRARLQSMAQSLADARFELCRVKSASGHAAEIELVRSGSALQVGLTGPFLRDGDFGLMKVLQFEGRSFIADSPYLLKASEEEWREHLARVVAEQTPSAPASTAGKPSKLSSKEQARRRQKEKARGGRNEPEEIIKRYLKLGSSPRHWFDYIMDAYAGERSGIVFLAGVPDRPELLPHSDEYAGPSKPALSPLGEYRSALLDIAVKEGLLEDALRELQRLCDYDSTEEVELSPNEQTLLAAYTTLGHRTKDGTTALTRFQRSRAPESLHPDVRSFIDSVENGWFSVLRVDRIHLDEGLEVFDLLRKQKLKIRERSATRQLGLGDLLLGWLCKDQAGTLTLEGGLAHVPSFGAAPMLALVADLRKAMPPLADEQEWKLCAAELPLPLIAALLALRADPALPELRNTSGDSLELITAHYRVRDRARVVAALSEEFTEDGEGSYVWLDEADTVLARFELSPAMLRVHVNSRKRSKTVQKRLEGLLGDAVERSLEAHEDVGQAVRARRGTKGKRAQKSAPLELSPEVTAELHEMVLAKIRSTLDEPIPQFKGKTLRQLAKSAKGRPDAVSWLREQERILKTNPQLSRLDLRPLWEELALPFQGLETDPGL